MKLSVYMMIWNLEYVDNFVMIDYVRSTNQVLSSLLWDICVEVEWSDNIGTALTLVYQVIS